MVTLMFNKETDSGPDTPLRPPFHAERPDSDHPLMGTWPGPFLRDGWGHGVKTVTYTIWIIKFLVSKNSLILEYLNSEREKDAIEFIVRLNWPLCTWHGNILPGSRRPLGLEKEFVTFWGHQRIYYDLNFQSSEKYGRMTFDMSLSHLFAQEQLPIFNKCSQQGSICFLGLFFYAYVTMFF